MSRSVIEVLFQWFLGLGFIGMTVLAYMYTEARNSPLLLLIAVAMGLGVIGIEFFAPLSITIQGNSILVGYFFTSKTFTAAEITLYFTHTQNRKGGKSYFVRIAKQGVNGLRFSSLKPSLPIAYLIPKNWHKKNA
jgi:hypothetical protein